MPGKENPWDGWHLAIANFKRDFSGTAKLTNRSVLYRGRVLTSDYAWSPFGREIAVYYAIFGKGSISQKIDILHLDRAY